MATAKILHIYFRRINFGYTCKSNFRRTHVRKQVNYISKEEQAISTFTVVG